MQIWGGKIWERKVVEKEQDSMLIIKGKMFQFGLIFVEKCLRDISGGNPSFI